MSFLRLGFGAVRGQRRHLYARCATLPNRLAQRPFRTGNSSINAVFRHRSDAASARIWLNSSPAKAREEQLNKVAHNVH